MDTILAIDLGKFKSCFCRLDTSSGELSTFTLKTTRREFFRVFSNVRRQKVIVLYESGSQAGWVSDMLTEMKMEFKVANVCHPAWRWKENQNKSDKNDAQRLINMYTCGFFPEVHVPTREVRQKRNLVRYRQKIVRKIQRCKNSIRAIICSQAIELPTGKKCWTKEFRADIEELAVPIELVDDAALLWKGNLYFELEQLNHLEATLKIIEKKLHKLVEHDKRIELVMTIPGVGPRTAEALVYILDDPHRFKNSRHVSSYVGLSPRRYQSGNTDYSGGISKQGNRLLRGLLTQAAWVSLSCGWSTDIYKRVRQGSSKRTNIAIIAVARHILIRAWAMLRDDCCWDQSKFKSA